ncbi:MAG: flagellar biosynthetic protein FliR [Longimicrobiales bacterium]
MDLTLGDGALVWSLLLFRCGGLLLIAPAFSAAVVPVRIKTALALLLTLLMYPSAMAARVPGLAFTPGTMVSELLVGFTIGLGAAVFVGAAEAAGDMMAVQMGLSGASIVDPLSRNQVPVLGQLLGLTVLMLILAADGHVYMLEAVHRSFELIPIGGIANVEGTAANAAHIGSSLFRLGLRFAGPVIGALMVGHVALGVLARTVPQMNVLMMAFPLQIAVGLFVLATTLPAVAAVYTTWPDSYGDLLDQLLGRL